MLRLQAIGLRNIERPGACAPAGEGLEADRRKGQTL
jgi:hypothetical protein